MPGGRWDLGAARTGLTNSNRSLQSPSAAGGSIVEVPPPPDLDERATAYWNLYAPALIELRVLRPEDMPRLRRLCQATASADEAFEEMTRARQRYAELVEVDTSGMTDRQLAGHSRACDRLSAAIKRANGQYRDADTMAYKSEQALGVGVVARAKLGVVHLTGMSLAEQINNGLLGSPVETDEQGDPS